MPDVVTGWHDRSMVTSDDVRAVALALPRAREQIVGGRAKLKVKQYVFCAFSRDEASMGFGFPRDERPSLIESDPETYFWPPASDLRYQWVCAHLARLDLSLMSELVVDAWRMCVPAMLHDLPDLPTPAAALWNALDSGDLATARSLIHPDIQVTSGRESLTGRRELLAWVAERGALKPPAEVEIRGHQVYRWTR